MLEDYEFLFLAAKARLHCDKAGGVIYRKGGVLFLAAKARLHCDTLLTKNGDGCEYPFPGRQGQAPLRLIDLGRLGLEGYAFSWPPRPGSIATSRRTRQEPPTLYLFLAAKARLHCDPQVQHALGAELCLFLAAKARLHCDTSAPAFWCSTPAPFPGRQGQAPLRHFSSRFLVFDTSAFSWPPRPGSIATKPELPDDLMEEEPFPGRQGQAPLRLIPVLNTLVGSEPFPGRQGQAPLRRQIPAEGAPLQRSFSWPPRPGSIAT